MFHGAHTRPHHPRPRRHPILSASSRSSAVAEANALDVDLVVVVGARGLTGLRAFLGSVSNHLLQHAHRPLLIIPPRTPSPGTAKPDRATANNASA